MVPIKINKVAGSLNKGVPAMPNLFLNYDQNTNHFPNQSINVEDTSQVSNQGV